jgi:hypothetical protein
MPSAISNYVVGIPQQQKSLSVGLQTNLKLRAPRPKRRFDESSSLVYTTTKTSCYGFVWGLIERIGNFEFSRV